MNRISLFSLLALLLLFATGAELSADDFPAPFNTDPAGESGPMPAEEAAKGFTTPDGFKVSVFASEPDVQNPIAMAWDHKGRMWVAENYTYGSRKVRFQMGLRDRVLVFEDKDNDGESVNFCETIQWFYVKEDEKLERPPKDETDFVSYTKKSGKNY